MEDDGILDPKCVSCLEYVYPILKIITGDITIYWTAHLPLEPTELPLTAATLRPRLAELRDNIGRFICPPIAPGINLPELTCLDSNICDCIHFQGSQNVDWKLCSTPETKTGGHTDPTKRLSLPNSPRRSGQSSRQELSDECEFDRRNHIAWFLAGEYGPGDSRIKIGSCHSAGLCLVVGYSREIPARFEGNLHPYWYQALDPDSYNLTADIDGFGVYWCRQEQCCNYYRRVPGFSRIIYRKEYTRKCYRFCK